MKKWIKIAGLLLFTLPVAVQAEDYAYTTNFDNTITITKYTGSGGVVTIPGIINGLSVTSIVTRIESEAFYNARSVVFWVSLGVATSAAAIKVFAVFEALSVAF